MEKSNIYLAASYHRKKELKAYAKTLEAMGHSITSRWLDNAKTDDLLDERFNKMPNEYKDMRFNEFAARDLHDICVCDTFLCFTEPIDKMIRRGGFLVEFGYFLALRKFSENGDRAVIIGDKINIFCCLDRVEQYETFEDFLKHERENDDGKEVN